MANKKNDLSAAKEPISTYGSSSELNADVIWQLFQETDKKFQETDRLFKELDKKLEKSANEWEEIKKELGGIGKQTRFLAF